MSLSSDLVQAWPGQLGLMVLDHEANSVVAHNPDQIFPSASLIKTPLAWQWLEMGQTSSTYTIQAADIIDPEGVFASTVGQTFPRIDMAREMIVSSENNATNLVLDWVGGFGAANRWLTKHHHHRTRWERRMCDWEARAAGYENTTSANEMALFFHSLYRTVLAKDDEAASIAYAWLEQCVSEGKLDCGIPAGANIAHKTGSLPDGVEHDAGIVGLPDGRWYAVAILSHVAEPETSHRARIAHLSRLIFEELD